MQDLAHGLVALMEFGDVAEDRGPCDKCGLGVGQGEQGFYPLDQQLVSLLCWAGLGVNLHLGR